MAGIVLAFDFGLKRIGVAVGNGLTGTASALQPLAARQGTPDWERVAKLIAEWRPERLLVGLPLNMDGTPSDMSVAAERFARRLHGRFGLPCDTMDERLSTREARDLLAAGEGRASRDSVAACVILEGWFAQAPPAAG